MPRSPRYDYPGATHHVFVRGVARTAVAVDDADYERSLHVLEKVASRFELVCHAWCLLPNHAHLLVTSQQGNLSRAMHWFGTCTAQAFNRRHDRSGHLYQGRFGSRLVANDRYFLQLVRYVALNPVQAGLCGSPADWRWSSYSATAGLRPAPRFLDAGAFLGLLEADDYVAWVAQVDDESLDEHGVPRPPPRPALESLLLDDSNLGIALAHLRHGYTQAAIAKHLGVSASQICRRLGVQG
ncbi:MAG: REP-associated tyrosine transposase [Gaiellales bacterium]|jgi:REP element-mobilizing transposase RayT|nr:REP-associated tyrosine transposase [Gaiellales bacterium]MDX6600076.1 REP-associated tyrosine transposase [Gaiellales bacterium]